VYYLWLWLSISVVISCVAAFSSRSSFLAHFREAATQRFDEKQVSPNSLKLWLSRLFRLHLLRGAARFVPGPARRRPVLAFLFLGCVVVVLLAGVRQFYWRAQLRQRLASIRQNGEPASLAEIGKYITPVAARENGLATLQEAGWIKWTRWNPPKYLRKRRVFSKVMDSGKQEEIGKILAANAGALKALRNLTNFSKGYLLFGQPNSFVFQNSLINYAELLQLELLDAFEGQGEGETMDRARIESDIEALVAFARIVRQVPDGLAQPACLESLKVLNDSLEVLFTLPKVQIDKLRRWKTELDQIEAVPALRQRLAVLRAGMPDAWIQGEIRSQRSENLGAILARSVFKGSGSRDRTICWQLDELSRVMEECDRDFSSSVSMLRVVGGSPSQWGNLLAVNSPVDSTIQVEGAIRASIAVLKTAIALEEYRIEEHRIPSGLGELTPKYLKSVPMDPFNPGSFVQYSMRSNAVSSVSHPLNRPVPPPADQISFKFQKESFRR
jgi:hypothetical protein